MDREVPENRQTYDTDLRDFRIKLNAPLQEMRANAIARPGSKTAILGAIALASSPVRLRHQVRRVQLCDISAVDGETGSGDETCFFGRQVGHQACDLGHVPYSLQRNERLQHVGVSCTHVGCCRSGLDVVESAGGTVRFLYDCANRL